MKKSKSDPSKLKIEQVPIDQIKAWEDNPKEHNIEAIDASMDEYGITKPILVNKRTMKILGGHGRLEVMKRRGLKTVPVIFLDMSTSRAKRYAVVDNETTISGGWNELKLANIISELKDEGEDIMNMGFNPPEIAEILEKIKIRAPEDVNKTQPEITFATELFEAQNYIVFAFNNELDYLTITDFFKLPKQKELDDTPTYQRRGTGRVIDGKALLKLIKK